MLTLFNIIFLGLSKFTFVEFTNVKQTYRCTQQTHLGVEKFILKHLKCFVNIELFSKQRKK